METMEGTGAHQEARHSGTGGGGAAGAGEGEGGGGGGAKFFCPNPRSSFTTREGKER